LLLASHLAQHLRQQLESQKGYTATVGISTNKLLAKLVGNLKKPNAQTTLLPPYVSWDNIEGQDNVTTFMDNHEIGKIPGIGFKMAQKLRAHVLQRSPDFDAGLVYGGTKEKVRVCEVRQYPGMGPDLLERILGGTGTPHGIGARVWGLLNGCDDSEVGQARVVPRQISIEDSYLRLDNMDKVAQELRMLARSLLRRIHTDLIEDGVEDGSVQALPEAIAEGTATSKRWIAHPRTVRLSTRPRPPQNPDGSRHRSFARISKSAPMPNFVFNSGASIEDVAERLVSETLLPLFRRLHPEKTGWNLSLVNVAVTNMADAASEKGGVGRNISNMFKRQDDVLKAWRVEEGKEERDGEEKNEEEEEAWIGVQDELRPIATASGAVSRVGSEDAPTLSQSDATVLKDVWESDGEDMTEGDTYCCEDCGALMPLFAMGAHIRWHAQG
jgi:DNA polymerase iota